MVNRFFIAAPLALVAAAAFVGAAVPALAATPQAVCDTTPAALRSAETAAPAAAQQRAAILISTGEHLCADRARAEAAKKFEAAARILGVDLATLTAPATVATAQ